MLLFQLEVTTTRLPMMVSGQPHGRDLWANAAVKSG